MNKFFFGNARLRLCTTNGFMILTKYVKYDQISELKIKLTSLDYLKVLRVEIVDKTKTK